MIFDDSILNELWNGNIFPQEYLLNTDNKEINEVSSTLDKMHFELADKIDNNLFDKFNKYEKEHGKYLELISREAFKLGFSMAVQIMGEAYKK